MSSHIAEGTEVDPRNPSGKTFFGHPRMLANLFSVEMWERFSFYGMQGILVYYLYYSAADGGLGFDQAAATGIIGAYGGMVYLMAIVGGYLGDRVFGPEKTLFYSAIAIMFGHLALSAIPNFAGVIIGLVLIAVGSGCLKTNASVLVASLYDTKDMRREAGFTVFYMGVNIGALFGPLLTNFGWGALGFHFGFLLAAIGMAFGLLQYWMTRKNLPESVHYVNNPASTRQKSLFVGAVVVIVALVLILSAVGLITPDNISNWVIGVTLIGAIILCVILVRSKQTTADEHSRVLAFIPLWIGNAVFWALYQQQFTVMAVYSDSRLDWHLFGMEFKPGLFQSINPVFIILLGTVFATLWTKLGNRQPSTVTKFALGMVGVGIAFLIFLLPAGHHIVSLWWLVLILFVCTISELTLSPTGTSATTRFSPEAHKSQMMAWYWTSVAMGTALSGFLAKYYSEPNEVPYFATMGLISVIAGIILWLFRKPILTMMRGLR
ncbi:MULTISPECIES: peptide MFS transporter [Kocuria]|uniref:peptide MFS transporter n=1 Tax=Kocuria TaxID=57493 RepID=UPI00066046CF|nr:MULTISPECIES: oligopeptide:H+ symporter [Kocuria]MCT1368128.1 oligopeptide:H+ symporter [Rothia sp. p3-SID1597]RUQ20671.1 MFS transporter [Kocuria sp. HSID16901]